LSLGQLEDRTVNSSITVHIFQGHNVVLFMGEETDDPAAAERSRSLAQLRRHSADLLALSTQKNSVDRSDFYLCAGLAALLKLQSIALNGQSSVAVALCVFQTQKMSGPNAEWCARVYWGSGALGQCA
jgi:hypothetical protein